MFTVWGGMEMDYQHWFVEPKLWQRNRFSKWLHFNNNNVFF